jgi:predicted Rossmann-fold nucleotide-binding protein
MSFSAESYIFYPGGFGTLDEFFEIITLVQTKKIRAVPIILVGSDFWKPLEDFIIKTLLQAHAAIEKKDLKLFTITDDHEAILKIILKEPVRS